MSDEMLSAYFVTHQTLMPASKEKVRRQSAHAVTTTMRQAPDIRDAKTAHESQALSPHEKFTPKEKIERERERHSRKALASAPVQAKQQPPQLTTAELE